MHQVIEPCTVFILHKPKIHIAHKNRWIDACCFSFWSCIWNIADLSILHQSIGLILLWEVMIVGTLIKDIIKSHTLKISPFAVFPGFYKLSVFAASCEEFQYRAIITNRFIDEIILGNYYQPGFEICVCSHPAVNSLLLVPYLGHLHKKTDFDLPADRFAIPPVEYTR